MRAYAEFAIAPRPMATPWSGPGPALLPLPHSAPSVAGLVEAVLTLNATDAFRPRFTAEQWRLLASYLVREVLPSGEALVRPDGPGRAAFLVESGTLLADARRSGRGPASIALLRAGALAGESALFGEMPCMAQVDAISPCVVWALRRHRQADLLASHPGLAYELLRAAGVVMRQRLRAAAAQSDRRAITSEHIHANPSPRRPSLRFAAAAAGGRF